METNPSPTLEGFQLLLPSHLTENFEKAAAKIRELYGVSPDVTALLRLWIACGTSSLVRREFELAVLEIKNPMKTEVFDEDTLKHF